MFCSYSTTYMMMSLHPCEVIVSARDVTLLETRIIASSLLLFSSAPEAFPVPIELQNAIATEADQGDAQHCCMGRTNEEIASEFVPNLRVRQSRHKALQVKPHDMLCPNQHQHDDLNVLRC